MHKNRTLQHKWARFYDSNIGKWTSQDPIGFDAGDSNLYLYSANSPLTRLDPSGLLDFDNVIAPQMFDLTAEYRQMGIINNTQTAKHNAVWAVNWKSESKTSGYIIQKMQVNFQAYESSRTFGGWCLGATHFDSLVPMNDWMASQSFYELWEVDITKNKEVIYAGYKEKGQTRKTGFLNADDTWVSHAIDVLLNYNTTGSYWAKGTAKFFPIAKLTIAERNEIRTKFNVKNVGEGAGGLPMSNVAPTFWNDNKKILGKTVNRRFSMSWSTIYTRTTTPWQQCPAEWTWRRPWAPKVSSWVTKN